MVKESTGLIAGTIQGVWAAQKSCSKDAHSQMAFSEGFLKNYVKDRVSVSSKKTDFVLPGQESLKGRVVGRTFENLA